MYTNKDFKFYFDTLNHMRGKVNSLEDEVKELSYKLPFDVHGKVVEAHYHLGCIRDLMWEMDKMVEKLRDGQ